MRTKNNGKNPVYNSENKPGKTPSDLKNEPDNSNPDQKTENITMKNGK